MTSTQISLQGTFSGSHDLQLFYQSWYPTRAAQGSHKAGLHNAGLHNAGLLKGVLAIVHGLGEHSGRYCAVVKGLTAAGYAVFGFDNQGHGKSEGQRGHIDSWQDYRNNARTFLQLVRKKEPGVPLFVMGHSLGGLIVLDYVLRHGSSAEFRALQVQGLVVSAPPIEPMNNTATSTRVMLARLLSGLLPRLTLKMGLDGGGLSRDRAVTVQAAKDPLTHPYVTLRWGSETLSTIAWVKTHIHQLTLPVLLTHGGADPIVASTGTQAIFQQIQSPDKTLRLYPGSYHEPHNDLDADQVVSDLLHWLDGHIAAEGLPKVC